MFFLLSAILLGIIVRLNNILPFKIYPDAYQNLLVAENIQKYGSVVGTLGDGGYLFPPFFMWSRPVYAFLINFAPAEVISFTLGVLAIPLAYFLLFKIFKNIYVAASSSLILAASFNHTVQSGLIMTETTGIFFMLLFLLSHFISLEKKSFRWDVLTGALFSIAVFSRYEYIIISAIGFYFILKGDQKQRILNSIYGFLITSVFIYLLLFPPFETIKIAISQTKELLFAGLLTLPLIVVITKIDKKLFLSLVRIALYLTPILFFIPYFSGVSNFFKHDFLFFFSAFSGMYLLTKSPKDYSLTIVSLLGILFLATIYTFSNPAMERYLVHTIPFLIIPAGYFWYNWNLKKGLKISLFFLLLACQFWFSLGGIKGWSGDWNTESYEETAAVKLKSYIMQNDVLVAAFPEPYYYFTHQTTISIKDEPPFFVFGQVSGDPDLLIVQDMGLRDVFPTFSEFLDNELTNKKIGQYTTGKNYRYRNYFLPEAHDINVYRIKLSDIKAIISTKTPID